MKQPTPESGAPGAPDGASARSFDALSLAHSAKGKRILVCVTGGIAAYKSATIVSKLAQAGAGVTVAMTDAATHFVTPLTFQSLSGNPVYTSSWDHIESKDPQHISLASAVDLTIVAPCTMDCMAKLATGRTDDVVTLILSAVDRIRQPVLLAPSMNAVMWGQPATQRNLQILKLDGFVTIGPDAGWQACRTVGTGRMSEPEAILRAASDLLAGKAR